MPNTQRIILVNSSRLLREMLHTVLSKAEHLQVVREVSDQEELPSAIDQLEAEWLVISLPFDRGLPDWVDQYISNHPLMRLLAVSTDSSEVKLKWLESREENLEDLSLNDLLHILENDPNKLVSPRSSSF
jgi:DNA-binding NarL/FixJ family response regulator